MDDVGGRDVAPYDELLRRSWPNVVRYVGRQLGRGHPDIEDLAQKTLETAWRKRDAAPAVDGMLPWLLSIARNHVRNFRKHGDRRVIATELPDRAWVSDGGMPALERRLDLALAWRALRAGDREVLCLAYLDELTIAEIAEVIGRNETAVRQRLSRGRQKLRGVLDAMNGRQTAGQHGRR